MPDDPARPSRGCPDKDGDKIPDKVDKCPDEPGPAETEGCPVPEPSRSCSSPTHPGAREIMFETNEAVIQPQSFKMLDDVFRS